MTRHEFYCCDVCGRRFSVPKHEADGVVWELSLTANTLPRPEHGVLGGRDRYMETVFHACHGCAADALREIKGAFKAKANLATDLGNSRG